MGPGGRDRDPTVQLEQRSWLQYTAVVNKIRLGTDIAMPVMGTKLNAHPGHTGHHQEPPELEHAREIPSSSTHGSANLNLKEAAREDGLGGGAGVLSGLGSGKI
jgi:hypothetical protein